MGILRDVIAQRRDDRNGNNNSSQDFSRSRLLPRLSDYAPTGNSMPDIRARGSRCQRRNDSRVRQAAYMQPGPSPFGPPQGDQPRYYTSAFPSYPADSYVGNSYTSSPSAPPLPIRPALKRSLDMPPPSVNPISYPNPAPPSYSSSEYFEHPNTLAYTPDQYSTSSQYLDLPLAIPQSGYGSTSPFLRAYSEELLGSRGISQASFIAWIDAFNVASTPSAELQIVGKVAGVAGFFVPGAAGLIPTAVQIGAGLGGYATKRSATADCLARGNAELFNRAGLQLIICTTPELEQAIGYTRRTTPFTDPTRLQHDIPSRLEMYANYLSPLSAILPAASPPQNANSPVAGWGASLSERDRTKALSKAQKDASEGKSKRANALEADLRWILIVPRK